MVTRLAQEPLLKVMRLKALTQLVKSPLRDRNLGSQQPCGKTRAVSAFKSSPRVFASLVEKVKSHPLRPCRCIDFSHKS